ncbi:allantoate amidohydrolase [Pseudokineococcus sp. 1T1Z-3]|uniref:allantoate amidohydrolase n=1 Tax=Pseudokineococcus sp. 1T1Z-3 TaxID=3132745 RepID=UPI0030B638EA
MTATSSVLGATDREDAARVLARCDELGALSSRPDALERVHLSGEHAAANALVAGWLRAAGATSTHVDQAGNVRGRLEGREPGLPALVLGSHLDTVPDAGRYDGPLGVVLAVEVLARLARAQTEDGLEMPCALEVVGFGDEEGVRFATALLGSRALAGSWDETWWDGLVDAGGTSLRAAAEAFGLDPARVGEAALRPEQVVGYLETHIEQGPLLEEADLPLGVVTGIAGARRFRVTVVGEARHAGGTPWDRRRDALTGAAEVVLAVEREARAAGAVATTGWARVEPGALNVIPGRVELGVDLRAETDALRDATWDAVLLAAQATCAARALTLEVEEVHCAPAVACAPRLADAVAAGITAVTGEPAPRRLPSWAGHDAMAVAGLTDVGMLFVRCAGGISHAPGESVRGDDVALALDAFEAAVLAVVSQVG